jgi:outer membrane protein assembly factor BamA
VLGIAISEGPAATLVEVRVEGNTHSRSELVQRLSGLHPEERVDAERVHEASALLQRSGMFASVQEPLYYRAVDGGERVGVLLRVVETERRNTIFGALGLARDPATNNPYVNGAIDLRLFNIYGTGRDLALAWRRDRLAGSQLVLSYRERFLFGWPPDLKLDLQQTVRDSTYTFQSAGAALVVPLGRNVGLEGGGAFDRSVFHVGALGNSERWRGRMGILLQSVSTEAEGRRFGRIGVFAEVAHKSSTTFAGNVEEKSNTHQTLWNGSFDAGVHLAARHVLAGRGEWRFVESDDGVVSESEQFYFGGARTLRGYREDQFRGEQVAYGGVEYRYGVPGNAQAYTFVDAGGLRRREAGFWHRETHAGYGAGLRGQVATGIFDIAVGVGDEGFAAAKLHVSLLQRF